MTQRRRSTWTDRKASAPPATPGYAEGTDHPAWPGPDPDANKYMNGDPSSWAEDPHPGPYPNPPPPPADPGMQEPQGHPATDPAHYFPGGTGKSANRDVQAALEVKAQKCIRLASAMLGDKAKLAMVEDQALAFMHLSDNAIKASLDRLAEAKGGNYTLTPERKADDLLAEDEKKEAKKADDDEDEKKEAKKSDDEMVEEASKKAAFFRRLASQWDAVAKGDKTAAPSGNQNDPAHYNYEGTDLGKKAAEDDEEKMLAEMMEEEAKKKAAAAKSAKDEPFGGKKAPPFGKKDDEEKKEAKKADDDEPAEEKKEAKKSDDEADEKKEAKKSDDEPAEEKKEAKKSDDEEDGADKEASVSGMLAGLMDEPVMADDDPMNLMDLDDPMSDEEMAVIYGGRYAKAGDDEPAEEKKEAKKSDDETDEKEGVKHVDPKAASAKPQPRLASTGPRTLGTVAGNSRTAGAEIRDLERLWESAPDVTKHFGGR